MMEIFWTMLASQDRKRIREYIAEQNLMALLQIVGGDKLIIPFC